MKSHGSGLEDSPSALSLPNFFLAAHRGCVERKEPRGGVRSPASGRLNRSPRRSASKASAEPWVRFPRGASPPCGRLSTRRLRGARKAGSGERARFPGLRASRSTRGYDKSPGSRAPEATALASSALGRSCARLRKCWVRTSTPYPWLPSGSPPGCYNSIEAAIRRPEAGLRSENRSPERRAP